MSVGDRIAKAQRLQAILEDEVMKECFAAVEKECYDLFRTSKSPEEARAAWDTTHAIEALKEQFAIVLDDGKRALFERKLEEIKEQKAPRKLPNR